MPLTLFSTLDRSPRGTVKQIIHYKHTIISTRTTPSNITMVSFIKLLATLSMFSATALTTPAPVPEGVDITVFDYSAAAELAQGLEARQEKTCLAFM